MFKTVPKVLRYWGLLRKTGHGIRYQSGNTTDIFINGKPVTVPSYFTVIQALRKHDVGIPSFCYHERLSIAGNCRMCIIQIEGAWKPQIACATPVSKGLKIRTNSPEVAKAQEGVLEFILTNHPLDCPICDQGGECDLQDLSMRYGNDRSRYTDIHFLGKNAVEDKELGPLIRAEMTRCIHCTRCIRFGSEIAGIEVLGTAGRGHNMLIGTFVEKMFLSEVSANIIDLCPVGALTAKPYMFKARPWEVTRADSIDVTDATGTNISVNFRFDRVLRILPRENEEVNQEWVSDKGRFAIDSLEMQRLVCPMVRGTDLCLSEVEWHTALCFAAQCICGVQPHKIVAIAGPHTNVETLVATKDMLNTIRCDNCYIERSMFIPAGIDLKAAFSLNVQMKDIAKADCIILVGTNPRFEAPILNVWIREAYRDNDCDIFVVGPSCEFNYCVTYLGETWAALDAIPALLDKYKKPLIFYGIDQLRDENGSAAVMILTKLVSGKSNPDWGIINCVTREASFAGALEVGYKPNVMGFLNKCKPELVISLGADTIFNCWAPTCPVIYIGFQGDIGAQSASVILPGSAYTEAGGMFLNMEGRPQVALPAVTPPGKARYDWKIIRALAEYCGVCLFYCDQTSILTRMTEISPSLSKVGKYQKKTTIDLSSLKVSTSIDKKAPVQIELRNLADFYCTDIFSYNSPTMIRTRQAAYEYKSTPYAKN